VGASVILFRRALRSNNFTALVREALALTYQPLSPPEPLAVSSLSLTVIDCPRWSRS